MTGNEEIASIPADSALREFVWRSQEIGLLPPPIPDTYHDTFQSDFGSDSLWTDRSLLNQLGRFQLASFLQGGNWPRTGMAFRFSQRGQVAFWQCLLVGRVSLILMDLRLFLTDGLPTDLTLANFANARLAKCLSDEITLSRYLVIGEPGQDEGADVLIYANPSGYAPTETQYRFYRANGLKEVASAPPLFDRERNTRLPAQEAIILKL